MSVLVGMVIGSKTSSACLVEDSLRTIIANIGDPQVLVAVGVSPGISKDVVSCATRIAEDNPGRILLFPGFEGSWARFANLVIEMSSDFKWTIFSHDDVQILSNNIVGSVETFLEHKKDNIGWISFRDMDYLNSSWAPSIREGFHIDAMRENAWSKKKTHQFHSLPDDWYKPNNTREYLTSLKYDIPKVPVRCHGPFSHFIMIESDKLRNVIKHCEDWSPVSLLIDEDWGLTAMKNNLYNIWMPNLLYVHVRPKMGTRANGLIDTYGKSAGQSFKRKWRFPHKAIYTNSELREIRLRFKGTFLPWSMFCKTYEWDDVQ